MKYGLTQNEVTVIIKEKLNKNPDIFYFIENDYIEELVELLSAGVAEAIEKNTKKVFDDIAKEKQLQSFFTGK